MESGDKLFFVVDPKCGGGSVCHLYRGGEILATHYVRISSCCDDEDTELLPPGSGVFVDVLKRTENWPWETPYWTKGEGE